MSGWNDQYRDPRLIPDRLVRMLPPEERKRLGRHCMTQEERQEKIDAKSEKVFQDQIASLLRHREIFFGQQRMDRRSNIVIGYPDFWFCYRGVPIALEAKVGSNQQTPEQIEAQRKMTENGWNYYVVRSLTEVKEILERIG
jgi:hypothetical protein